MKEERETEFDEGRKVHAEPTSPEKVQVDPGLDVVTSRPACRHTAPPRPVGLVLLLNTTRPDASTVELVVPMAPPHPEALFPLNSARATREKRGGKISSVIHCQCHWQCDYKFVSLGLKVSLHFRHIDGSTNLHLPTVKRSANCFITKMQKELLQDRRRVPGRGVN